jgi:acylglycerol lipase
MNASFTFKSADGINIQGYTGEPASTPVAVIALLHGMGEHAMRYAHVADYFNHQSIAFTAMDHRGHGKSEGQRGHSPSLDALLNDIELFITKTKELYPGIPVILYGHSMGGNVALNFILRKKPQLAGAIITGPYLRLAFSPPAWKTTLGKISARIIPTLTQPTGLETAAISRDTDVVKKYESDTLVHDKITSSFFVSVHFAGPFAIEHAADITLPMLIMHGGADRLTSCEATKEFAARADKNVELKIWEGLYHEIHNEPEKDEVLNYELGWIKRTILSH